MLTFLLIYGFGILFFLAVLAISIYVDKGVSVPELYLLLLLSLIPFANIIFALVMTYYVLESKKTKILFKRD